MVYINNVIYIYSPEVRAFLNLVNMRGSSNSDDDNENSVEVWTEFTEYFIHVRKKENCTERFTQF